MFGITAFEEYSIIVVGVKVHRACNFTVFLLRLSPFELSDRSANCFVLLARNSIYAIARYMPSPVRPSVRPTVCLSVTRVDQSKTVEVRITQPSPQSSSMTLVS